MKIVISGGVMHDLTSLFENKNVVKRAIVLNTKKNKKKTKKKPLHIDMTIVNSGVIHGITSLFENKNVMKRAIVL